MPPTSPPRRKTFGAPEIAFLGRSNVGKSGLFNALLGSKAAHTSSTPGRTRAINFFALHEAQAKDQPRPTLIFADLPGYGYAKISKSISAEWPSSSSPISPARTLALAVCLVDCNIPPQPSDRQLIDFFRQPSAASRRRHQVRPPLQQRARQIARRPQARTRRSTRSSLSPPNPKQAPKRSGRAYSAVAK